MVGVVADTPERAAGSLAAVLEVALWERHPQRLAGLPLQGCADVGGDCRCRKLQPCLWTDRQQSASHQLHYWATLGHISNSQTPSI